MPMLLSASSAILMEKSAVENVRMRELAMESRAIRNEYWLEHRYRHAITGDNPTQVQQRTKRKKADEGRIATRIDTLKISPKHTQTVASWVFTTEWFGPPVTYMRVVPLPMRSFV
jgi:hypothetical protein